MKISRKARREAKQLYRCCLVDGLIDESRVRAAVQQTISLKPRGFVAILSHFHRLVRLQLRQHQATVESAVPLATDLQSSVQGNLDRLYGAGLQVSFVQNPTLLGGLRVQVGSDVYDGSIRARLAALRESF